MHAHPLAQYEQYEQVAWEGTSAGRIEWLGHMEGLKSNAYSKFGVLH